MMATILALFGLAFSAFLVISGWLICRYVAKELAHTRPTGKPLPKAAIIAPCKDLDPDFEDNMRMLLHQDYPNYEIYFATLDEEDETYPVLKRLAAESTVPAHLFLGGFSKKRCQKLDNIIEIMDNMGEDIEVFAWIDSDSRITPDWLRNLVLPLYENEKLGATTGFRWYLPEKGRPLTYLLCLWTGIQFGNLYNPYVAATWGGSMAIRRDLFGRLQIRKKWERALSDDCVLNECVRGGGYGVRFISRCMTTSSSDHPVKDIVIFAIRQAIIGKLTLPKTWLASTISLTVMHTGIGYGLWQLIQALSQGLPIPWTAWGMLAFIPASILQAMGIMHAANLLSAQRPNDRLHGKLAWALYAPLAYLFLWMTLSLATLSNRFVWRKIYYRMITPHDTEVYKYPERFMTAP